VKVFLSSAYADLKDYSHAVSNAIDSVGHELISWEQETIKAGESISESINKNIESADLIVLIIGERYGSVVENKGISYTEHEYNLAIEKGKPVLVFISKKESEEQVNQASIGEFSNKLMTTQLVTFFSSPSELEAKIIQSISQYVSVVKSLQNKKYTWRTISGVSKEIHLSQEAVTNIVEGLPNVVIRSRVPDKKGRLLYATRKHYQESNSSVSRLIDWFAI